jgi:hypothetical protein
VPRVEPPALVALGLLAVSWGWWGWKQGAYFGTVMLPGTILLCVGALLLIRTAPWRARLSLSRPTRMAAISLTGLGGWTLLSALWSPAPDVALADAQRVFTYALAFGLGIWLCNLLRTRMELSLVPLALGGGLVALATLVTLLIGDDVSRYLENDGTLQFPLGYRNANAAFFLIAIWPLLGLGMNRSFEWPIRGAAIGGGTLCLELGLLSQSRASLIAGVAAIGVFIAVTPRRARSLVWIGLATVPAAFVVPSLHSLFHAAQYNGPVLSELHDAARAATIGAIVAIVAASIVARIEPALRFSAEGEKRADRLVARGLVGLMAVAAVAFVVAVGNPVSWVSERVSEFNSGQNQTLGAGSTRFSLDASSERNDLWRVALDDGIRDPVFGDGAGGFRYSYLLHRHSRIQNAHDAHSVELETLSELGLPGLMLLCAAIGGIGLGAYRVRKLGPSAASLSAIALAAGTYWLVHTSLDWFWPYPAVTAPVLALLGCACAPALMVPGHTKSSPGRSLLGLGVTVLALSALLPLFSLYYLRNARSEWQTNLTGAYTDFDRARSANPLAVEPYLEEGLIAHLAGQRQHSIDAFTQAADKRPEEWASSYFLARLYRTTAPRLAARELAQARRLNPNEPAIAKLQHRLDH